MSYASEPYAQFVDDLLRGLTGGVVRERFNFVDEEMPFRLFPPGPVVGNSLLVIGQSEGTFRRFRPDLDYTFTVDHTLQFRSRDDGTPAADAVWPDPGTAFYVSYDHLGPGGAAPRLTDRNPGSITRLLAESFAREYAVLSKQMESVYQAGFLDTAEGRDLDQLVTLLGISRRTRTFAAGSVVFSRSTPAVADIFVPAGTRLSTLEPPQASFVTTTDQALRRGNLTVEVPIRAETGGPDGVVPPSAIRVIHRPILGVESAYNPQATSFGGADETDAELRQRARGVLAGAGKATQGSLLSALATLPGVREKDIRVDEDHLRRPGVITLNIAAPLDAATCARALHLIEENRPAGVRVLHNIPSQDQAGVITPLLSGSDDASGGVAVDPLLGPDLFAPVAVSVILVPASGTLTAQDRASLKSKGEEVVKAFVGDAGVGEILVYHRLVAGIMAIEGVLDAEVEIYRPVAPPAVYTGTRRRNVDPGRALRATLEFSMGGAMAVEVGARLIALDVELTVTLAPALVPDPVSGDLASAREEVRLEVMGRLRDGVATLKGSIDVAGLQGLLPDTPDDYTTSGLHYSVEYLDQGVRIFKKDQTIPLGPLDRPWIRSVLIQSGGGA